MLLSIGHSRNNRLSHRYASPLAPQVGFSIGDIKMKKIIEALKFLKELLFLDHVIRDTSNDKLVNDPPKVK